MCMFHVNSPNRFGAKSIGIGLKSQSNAVIDMQFSLNNYIVMCVLWELYSQDKSIHITPCFHLAIIVVFGYDQVNV